MEHVLDTYEWEENVELIDHDDVPSVDPVWEPISKKDKLDVSALYEL